MLTFLTNNIGIFKMLQSLEMAHWVKELATQVWKPEFELQNPHKGGRKTDFTRLPFGLHMCALDTGPPTTTHTYTHIVYTEAKPFKNNPESL